ncbi:MAG TPA: hypothetical protein VKH37_00030, partial [Ferruginibacter sp.]|nr:hypothetical protein [Ferruginibacter sp.]
MRKKTFLFVACMFLAIVTYTQNALRHFTDPIEIRYDIKQPSVHYTVTVDSEDLTLYHIQMHINNVSDTFRLAMVTHPEYDDRFWRYVEDFSVQTEAGKGRIIREDSSLWRIIKKGDDCVVRYSIHPPVPV